MRVLFLTHRLPYAPNRGDRIRAYHIVRVLKEHADVDLVSLVHDADEQQHAADLDSLAASVTVVPVPRTRNLIRGGLSLAGRQPLTHVLLDAPGMVDVLERLVRERPPDVILAFCSGIAMHVVRPPLDRFPLVVDFVDVDSMKWQSLGETARFPLRLVYAREAKVLGHFEAALARRTWANTVVNEKEAAALEKLAPGVRAEVVPNGIDVAHFKPPGAPSAAPTVVFCGVMNYLANEEAAEWLAAEIWPRVRQQYPDARLQLVGADPSPRVARLADAGRGIEVTGRVPDVRPYLWAAAVSIAPLLTARGIQNKVLEAAASGLPCVVTPVVAAGLPDEVLAACRVAQTAEEVAEAVVFLLRLPPTERRRLAEAGDVSQLTWERRLAPLRVLLESAARDRK